MNSLRARLGLLLLSAVLLAVAGTTAAGLGEVQRQLRADLDARAERALDSLQTELRQVDQRLQDELDRVADSRGDAFPRRAPPSERYLWAADRAAAGRLDVVKVLGPDGAVLSSAHWPATLGVPDPGRDRYASSDAGLVEEPTPRGSAPALQRWLVVDGLTFVVGALLDGEQLAASRDRLAADRLSLCWGAPHERCIEAGDAAGPLETRSRALAVGGLPTRIAVGLDASGLRDLRRTLRLRAALVALLCAAAALAAGLLMAGRLTRPIEALALGAARVASGDLETRVALPGPGPREVTALVEAFNAMAADLGVHQEARVRAERVAAWREIARGLAHELKNPLTPIRGAMDVIRRARALDRPDFDGILEEQAGAVVDEVARLKDLADSFARFAQLPAPQPEPLELSAVAEHGLTLYATARELTVERRLQPAPVLADKGQLQTVVTNLVKNAVEALDERGPLRVSCGTDGSEAWLRVEDGGSGLDERTRERLFTPYFTTKGSKGTGLGLALAHRIVVEHGGRIAVGQSDLGGASFEVRLPADPSAPTG